MTYIGAFAVVLAVLFAWRTYCTFLSTELSDVRAFLRALISYRDKMKCYLETPSAWARGYEDERLSRLGFLERLREGGDVSEAYRLASEESCLPSSVDEVLCDCFSHLGEGYLESELAAIGVAISRLSDEEKRISSDISRRGRVAGALLGACAVGVVILVI